MRVIIIGEDNVSFENHNKLILIEYQKSSPNKIVVDDLVELSFAMRREDMTLNPLEMKQTLKKYPFFREEKMVN